MSKLELVKETAEWAQEKVDLLVKPDDQHKETSLAGFLISVSWYIVFALYIYSEYAPQNLTIPTISYSYPQTASDLVINLNYTNFVLTLTDPTSGADVSSKASFSMTSQEIQYPFSPINGSSFINCSSCSGIYTLDDNLALTSSIGAYLTLNTLDCTSEYNLCLQIPNYFSLNQSTGLFNNLSSTNTKSCVLINPKQIVQFDYKFSTESYTRTPGGLYGGKSETRTKFSHPDFMIYTYSKPKTSCTAGDNIFLLTFELALTTETVTIKYLTFLGYLSNFGGLQHSVSGILGFAAVILWKFKICDLMKKIKICDLMTKFCNKIQSMAKDKTPENPAAVEMASPAIPIQPDNTIIQLRVD